MTQKFLSSKLLVALNVFLISLLSVTWVSAHGGNTAIIHSCVNNTSGEIKIVAANANCPSNYRSLDWGIQGPAGQQGIQGPAGISGLEIVRTITRVENTPRADGFAYCPTGKQVLGGGYSVGSDNFNMSVISSQPTLDGSGWYVWATTNDYPNIRSILTLDVFAICANVAP